MADQHSRPPISPGAALKRRLVGEGGDRITQDALADALGVSRFTVNQILNEHRAVTPDVAVRLERVLGTSAEFWLDLQMKLDLYHARKDRADLLPTLPQLRARAEGPPV